MQNKEINLDELSVTELKAMIYDFNVVIQQTNNNIRAVNETIEKKLQAQQPKVKDPTDATIES